jgi:hypothetical protein
MYGQVAPKVAAFLDTAMECSVYLSPKQPGLSWTEIIEAGKAIGLQKGELGDALAALATRNMGDGRLLPHPSTMFVWGVFGIHRNPEYRNFDALDFIRSEFVSINQVCTSSGVRKITGMAFGCIAPTSAFGLIVRNAKRSFVVLPSRTFRTEVQRVQRPAKHANGRVSSSANQTGARSPPTPGFGSEKLVKGTRQRFSTPNQRRQCDDLVLPMFVTPGSDFLPTKANCGEGIPQRAKASSRPAPELRTMGAG